MNNFFRFTCVSVMAVGGSFACFNSPVLIAADEGIKLPNVSGKFYPDDSLILSKQIDDLLSQADSPIPTEDIFALVSPHAGYEFSGLTAAFGYKLIKNKPYKTVVILAPSHYYAFSGISIYPQGAFRTPLGDIEVDSDFTGKLLNNSPEIVYQPEAFLKEHSLEVQLPFLQKVLTNGTISKFVIPRHSERSPHSPSFHSGSVQAPGEARNLNDNKILRSAVVYPEPSRRGLPQNDEQFANFKIVPIIMGDCSFSTCRKLAGLLQSVIGQRRDVLVVVSTDMYHGYDYDQAQVIDDLTLGAIEKLDAQGLYNGLKDRRFQLCGGYPAVTALILAGNVGYKEVKILSYTNSAEVTRNKIKGTWTVGYSSAVIGGLISSGQTPLVQREAEQAKKEVGMLNKEQRKKLLDIARKSIEEFLKSGREIEIKENDPLLSGEMGSFVTLRSAGELRGCIGNIVGNQPLYLTVRDMAVEAATGDPRFTPVKLAEFKNIEIEISMLSPLEKVDSAEGVELGKHGVIVKRGFNSGVFLPQVASETGWSKEEFLSHLCAQKAGLPPDAWKDKSTEIFVFTAEVFSEKDY